MPIKKIKITDLVQDDKNLNKGNARGKELCELPADADRTADTAAWQMLKSVLDEIKAL